VGIERSKQPIASGRITATVRRLLDGSTLCAIATVTRSGRAHVNTAYFAWSADFSLIWLSEPGARHSRNIRANGSAAVAVYDSRQTWGKPDCGIQLFGTAREAGGAAEELYAARFPEYRQSDRGTYSFYRLRPQRLKLFDEGEFGPGVFVTARVLHGAPVWERTDVYTNVRS
jgi:uncharacterized protein YhbP (UPF0306 family)